MEEEIKEASKSDKVQALVDRLNKIQAKVYEDGRISYDDKAEWRALTLDIKWYGYVLRKKNVKNAWGRRIGTIWQAIPEDEATKRTRHFSAEWIKFSPPADHRNQCTTRCLYFLFCESIPYNSIRAEQNRIANKIYNRGICYGWNHEIVWGEILKQHDFIKIHLDKTIRRDMLANLLSGYGRILTHSSRHVAAVFNGKVYDSWNSMHGRCDSIYVQNEYALKVQEILRRL